MPRSVNAVASRARRKKMMKHAKGYFGRRKNAWTIAKNAVEKAWEYAYRDRKIKEKFSFTLDCTHKRCSSFAWHVLLSIYGKSKSQ
ncbi:MAG: hypothetical protein CM15mP32_1480 [Flavobacteriaceae bacterium]|nr:MAG: hypothetical protein CM15mP32_1480 [Flavobacteriaceae bacterium]